VAPLLSVSPLILDQSFPRDTLELRIAAAALGHVAECARNGRAYLLITNALEEFVESFDWSRGGHQHELLREIYSLINLWLLQPHRGLVKLELERVVNYHPHPLPEHVTDTGLAEFWADEVGRLLQAHDTSLNGTNGYFVGVACDSSFSGGPLHQYPAGVSHCFPLIGPDALSSLLDAYEWELDPHLHRQRVTFSQARNHVDVIGAIDVKPPRSGSHYKVTFSGARSWTLDSNIDPVPERFLKQLVPITGYPVSRNQIRAAQRSHSGKNVSPRGLRRSRHGSYLTDINRWAMAGETSRCPGISKGRRPILTGHSSLRFRMRSLH